MATFTQANLPLEITTPLGADKLLLESFGGMEAISQPFRFEANLLALQNTPVAFDLLLGQSVTIRLDMAGTANERRFFNGIVMQFSERGKVKSADGSDIFIRYRAMIAPQCALLQRKTNSKTFQQKSVVDILKLIFTGMTTAWEIQGTFEPRDYCIQYQETDFAFASRLMEEEGIYYFFKHADGRHTMVFGNKDSSHTDDGSLDFQDLQGLANQGLHDDRIFSWTKSQELRSGKFVAWDYNFQLEDKHLEAEKPILPTVAVGTVTHKLGLGKNADLELFDFPGEYAQRFDGINKGGGDAAADLQKIFTDNVRTVEIRMQQEALAGLSISGESNARKLKAGFKITLANHHNANGAYILTRVEHKASLEGAFTSDPATQLRYGNSFQCIPSALPYRPLRSTPKPSIRGTQSAIVVGPPGTEINTDKYGRVKVQFRWDRIGAKNNDSSCWVRVAQVWASKQFGAFHLPRIGDEVIVAFEEGDPDQPIIVGSVYNATNMPPYVMPDNMTQTGFKTHSTLNGTVETFHELRFEDKKDAEEIYFHSERDFKRVVERNDELLVGYEKHAAEADGNQIIKVFGKRTIEVTERDELTTIKKGNRTVKVEKGDDLHEVTTGKRTVTVEADDLHQVKTGNRTVNVDTGNDVRKVATGNRTTEITTGNDTTEIKAGKSSTSAMQEIELKVGNNSIVINAQGITIKGAAIKIEGETKLDITSMMTGVEASGILTLKGGLTKIN